MRYMLCLACVWHLALLSEDKAPTVAEPPLQLEAVAKELGSDQFEVRDAAMKRLSGLSWVKLAELDKLKAKFDDPEIRSRIEQLVHAMPSSKNYPIEKATASLQGRVVLKGPAPKRSLIDVSADPKIAELYKKGEGPRSESCVVDEKGSLANAIVFIEAGMEAYTFSPPSTPVVMRQKGGIYTPHTVGLMVGQALKVTNEDPTAHNVHEIRDRFNKQQAGMGNQDVFSFDEPGPVGLKCDIHPWMNANGLVFEHPFYCVTKDDGTFEIKNLIPGEYKIKVWHQKLKEKETTVRISAGETRTVEFEYEIEAKKP
ncbi:MAG: hypothetical protein KIS92_00615 [Planctomycetota bacterium]|nr:hypothetical protein [Planctomycetota bacterium]